MNVIEVFGIAISVALLGVWIITKVGKMAAQKREEKKWVAEQARLDALPPLDTRWLMRVPEDHTAQWATPRRCYGTRYNRLVIFDNKGHMWVGLAIPEVLRSLNEGEYRRDGLWVPFRGYGEAVHGDAVVVDGMQIAYYPDWMEKGKNPSDWEKWASIERKFRSSWPDGKYQDGMKKILQ